MAGNASDSSALNHRDAAPEHGRDVATRASSLKLLREYPWPAIKRYIEKLNNQSVDDYRNWLKIRHDK
jgi:hypothetical protein